MTDNEKLNVFISWSGLASRQVAIALRAWLPLIFDRVAPWASDRDIDAGSRGLSEIEAQLAATKFGILVVDSSNQSSTWLNFEAGALSRAVPDSATHVVPLLVDLENAADLAGPIAQFQAKLANEAGVRDVVETLAKRLGVPTVVAAERFRNSWPTLKDVLDEARSVLSAAPTTAPKRSADDKLDEILGLLRAQRSTQKNLGLQVFRDPAMPPQATEEAAEIARSEGLELGRVSTAFRAVGSNLIQLEILGDATREELLALHKRIKREVTDDVWFDHPNWDGPRGG